VHEVVDDLAGAGRISQHLFVQAGIDLGAQHDPALVGCVLKPGDDIPADGGEVHGNMFESDLPFLDLVIVEDIIDDRQQVIGGEEQDAKVFLLIGSGVVAQHQVGHSDDGVERCPDLV